MKIKTQFLLFFISLLNSNLIGQAISDEDFHRKYWFYKSHLNNDFIKIGLNFGESLPFNEKITKHSNTAVNIDLSDAPKLHSGDASARLGIYLSVLATEYRLLKNNNQDVSKVKHEIFCALNAINRLDRDAETYFDAPSPQNTPTLNGFFVRDDTRGDFVANNYKHFNYLNNLDKSVLTNTIPGYSGPFYLPSTILQDHGFTSTNLSGVYRTGSSWNSAQNSINNVFSNNDTIYRKALLGFEESMDQAYYLLMGLTLTSKLVDIGESDNGNVFPITATPGQISLRNEAKEIAERIILLMKNDPLFLIRNPANKLSTLPEVVQSLVKLLPPSLLSLSPPFSAGILTNHLNNTVQTGGAPFIYSYGLDNLGNFIKHGQSLPYFWFPIPLPSTSSFPVINQFPILSPSTNWYTNNLANYPWTSSFDFRSNISVFTVPFYMAYMNSGGGPRVDFQGFMNCMAGSGNNVYEQISVVNLTVETAIVALNTILAALSGTNKELNRADSIAHADFSPAIANAITGLINVIKAAKFNTNQQLIAAAISTAANYISKLIAIRRQYLHASVLKNVTDERLLYNYALNPVFFSLDKGKCSPPHSFVHYGSDQLFGIYLRDVLHPLITNPPTGFRWLNTLATPSRLVIKNTVKNQLANAPCNGNFNFGTGFMPPDPWGASCTMDRFDPVWDKSICVNNINKGEYSGLDFMLLHNLYYLTEQKYANLNVDMKDYIDRDLTDNFPKSDGTFASNNKKTFGAFEFIRANNTIASNGAAEIRAGKQITLLPGFTSAQGSDVKIFINPFHDCDWNTSTGMLRNAQLPNYYSNASVFPSGQYLDDGAATSEQTSSLNPEISSTENPIQIYPNPNEGTFNVQLNFESNQTIKICVINVLNETVYQNEIQAKQTTLQIQINESKGIYLVKIKSEQGKEFQKRLIIK